VLNHLYIYDMLLQYAFKNENEISAEA